MFDNDGRSGSGDEASRDVVCARIVSAVDGLAGEDPALLSLPEQVARLRTVSRLIDQLEAERVRLVGTAERSGALADDGSKTAVTARRRGATSTTSSRSRRTG